MMHSLMEWSAMGGYAVYVWPAYGMVSVVFAAHILSIHRQKKRTRKILSQWFKR